MASQSYHDETETLSCSQLKVYVSSPREYQGVFIDGDIPKRKPTLAMNFGTACHAILLEKKPIDDVIRVYPRYCLNSNGGLIGKKAKAFQEKIGPIIAMKEDDAEMIAKVCTNALKSPLGEIIQTFDMFEQRVEAVLNGVPCRCCPDIHGTPPGQKGVIYDFKFSADIHPDRWFHNAKKLGYHVQIAHYSRICEAYYGIPFDFAFWAFETKPPFRVERRDFDQRSVEIAKEWHEKKLEEFRISKATGDWSDRWNNTGTISPWDVGANDEGEVTSWEEDAYGE